MVRPDPSHTIDKHRIARYFKAGAASYDKAAIVQKVISRRLIDFLARSAKSDYGRVLEIGCCTGILTEWLCAFRPIDTLFLNDLVPDFCRLAEKRIQQRINTLTLLPGDIEKTDLPRHLDLVVSSSTLQWIADLPGLVQKIARALKPDGQLAFAIFSSGTMQEISALTGRGLRYHTRQELENLVGDHFRRLVVHTEEQRLFFPTLRAVLRHIRQTGVGGIDRPRWTMRALKEFERRYRGAYATQEGLSLTYVSTFVLAEGPKRSKR